MGKDFTRAYYDETDCYLADYESTLPPLSPMKAAFKQAEYYEVVLEAGRKLSSDPKGAVAALERYLAGDRALQKLEAVRARLRG